MGNKKRWEVVMKNKMRRGYELQSLFLGRPIRPFHLAVALSTGTIGWHLTFYPNNDPWYGWAAHLLGGFALLGALCLTVGWWWRSDRAAELGLLLAVGVWSARAAFIAIDGNEDGYLSNPWLSTLLSLAWAVGAGGAYLLERYDHVMSSGEGE